MIDTAPLRRKILSLAISGKLVPQEGEWKTVKLGDVCELFTGNSINAQVKSEKYFDVKGGRPFIATKDVGFDHVIDYNNGVRIPLEESEFRVAPSESTLLCIEGGSSGRKIGITNQDVCFGNKLCAFVVNKATVDCKWIYWYLQSPIFFSMFKDGESGLIGGTSVSKIRRISIPLPPLAEQKRIVKRVDELLKLESEIATESAALEDLITAAKRKILSLAISGKLVPQEGEWKTAKLGDVCEVFTDGDWIESKDQSNSGVRLVQTGNIGEGEFLNKENRSKFVSTATFDRLGCTEIFPGDVLISRLPEPVGRACILPNIGSRMITAVDCTIVRFKKEVLREYFICFACSPMYYKQISEHLAGTTRRRISRGNLAKIEIPLPPLAEQKRIVAKVEELFKLVDSMKA